jgi:hypothetical protein
MKPKPKCSVDGCAKTSHAKGYCRRHYSQMYRKGHIYPVVGLCGIDESIVREIRSTKLERAKEAYASACGVQARIFWRRELEALEAI